MVLKFSTRSVTTRKTRACRHDRQLQMRIAQNCRRTTIALDEPFRDGYATAEVVVVMSFVFFIASFFNKTYNYSF